MLITKKNSKNISRDSTADSGSGSPSSRGLLRRVSRLLPGNTRYTVILLLTALVAAAFLAMMAAVNAFPAGLSLGLAGALMILLILCGVLFCRKRRWLRIMGLFLAVLLISAYGLGTYYLGTTYAMFARISGNGSETASGGIDLTEDPFNIYVTGIDQWAKEKGLDLERSDVNMIVTVCPKTRRVLLTSIPRDTYVELYHVPEMDKLTHTGIYGVDETLNTVEKWLKIDLDYYVKLNFSSVRDIINAMGGIDVYSPTAFTTSLWGYKFEKGWNHLDGKEALFFARERKAFEGKDSIRVENQQRVVKACIDKLTKSATLLTSYGDILDAAGKNMETSLSAADISSLVKMQLQDFSGWDVETQKVEGEYAEDYVASLTHEQMFMVYKPLDSSVKKVRKNIRKTMNPTEEEIEQAEEARRKDSALRFIRRLLNRGGDETDPEAAEG